MSSSSQWRELAVNIESRGAILGVQLSGAPQGHVGQRSFIAKDTSTAAAAYSEIAKSITIDDLEASFLQLRVASGLAIDAGFRLIQLHAAHGYLFHLLLDRRLNPKCGRALELLTEWTAWIRSCGVQSSIRMSLFWDSMENAHLQDEFENDFVAAKSDFLDVSAGLYNVNKREIYPTLAVDLKKRLNASLDFASRYRSQEMILSGKSDIFSKIGISPNLSFGICRDLIANPNFLADRGQGCRNHMKCHYYSRGREGITCGVWNGD